MSKKKSKVLQKQELLYYAWKSETGYSSNPREIFSNPSYKEMISLAKIDYSFLERKLR